MPAWAAGAVVTLQSFAVGMGTSTYHTWLVNAPNNVIVTARVGLELKALSLATG